MDIPYIYICACRFERILVCERAYIYIYIYIRKMSVVNKSRNEEETFELRSQLEEISILVSMSLSPINLKC